MSARASALRSALPEHRVTAAERRGRALAEFQGLYDLDDSIESIILYLTSLVSDGGISGQALRRVVSELDLASVLDGRPPASSNRLLRLFLRGAHRFTPLGPALPRTDPLYREQVRILLDQVVQPHPRQLRDIAFLLIANNAGARYPALTGLRWNDIRLTKHRADVRLRAASGVLHTFRFDCADDTRISIPHVLRRLRHFDGPGDGAVLAQRGERAGSMRYRRLLRSLGATDLHPHELGRPWVDEERLRRVVLPHWEPVALAVRDRALVTMSFLGALTNAEATTLRVGDVTASREGLVIRLPFRPQTRVGLPRGRDSEYCPVEAWLRWLDAHDHTPLAPAFPRIGPMSLQVTSEAISETGLSEIIKGRASDAGLEGRYTFTSLRLGFVRSAIREGVADSDVAPHVGLRQLRTIGYERSREQLLSHGAATLMGL